MAGQFLNGINIAAGSLSIGGTSVISSARHAAFVNLTTTGDNTLGNATSDSTTINGTLSVSSNLTVSGSTNRSIILDYTSGSGGYSWMSFKQSGTEQFRVFGSYTDNYLSFYNDQSSYGHMLMLNSNGTLSFYGDILASADSSHDIGTSSVRFANIYADTLYGDGSNITGVTAEWDGSHTGTAVITGDLKVTGSSEDLLAIASQSAGSGTIIMSMNAAENAYEPLRFDVETFKVTASGGTSPCIISTSGLNTTFGGDVIIQGDDKDFYVKSADHTISRIINRGSGADLDKGLFSLMDTGTEDIRIDTGGNTWINTGYNVGIGTVSPTSNLHVEGAPANGTYLTYLYNSGTHNSSHGLNVQTASSNIAAYGLRVNTGGDSNALAVMGNGKVGIGLADPAEKLSVAGKVEIKSGNWLVLRNSDNSNYGSIRGASDTSNDVTINTNAEVIRFKQDGKVGIGTSVPPHQKLTVTGTSAAADGNLENGILALTTGTGVVADTRLLFGIVDDTYAWIQAADYGVAYRDISLNPNGGNVSIKVPGAAKAKLHVKNDSNSWEDGVLLEHHTGNTGWNIHPEDNSDNALWFGYNAATNATLANQAATAVLKLNSDSSATFSGAVNIAASQKIYLGGSTSRMQAYHTGSSGAGYVVNKEGGLNFVLQVQDANMVFSADNGAANATQADYFYLDGGSATHDGSSTTAMYTIWKDNSRVTFGNDKNLSIFHDGTNNQIRNEIGNLDFEQHANNADVRFYGDNGADGVRCYFFMDGSIAASGGLCYTTFPDDSVLDFGDSQDLKISHQGGHSYIENGTGALKIGCGTISFSTDSSYNSNYVYTFRDAVGINNPNATSAATSSTTVMAIGAKSGGTVNTSLITTGAVGVGIAAPTSTLHVSGTSNITSNATFGGALSIGATTNAITIGSLADNGTFLSVTQTGNETWLFKCESIGGGTADFVTIGASGGGYVAIAEDGGIAVASSARVGFDGPNGHTYIEEESDSNLKFYVAASERLNITNSNSTFAGTVTASSFIGDLQGGADSIDVNSTAANQVHYVINTRAVSGNQTPYAHAGFTYNPALGRVGIGLTDPGNTLEIKNNAATSVPLMLTNRNETDNDYTVIGFKNQDPDNDAGYAPVYIGTKATDASERQNSFIVAVSDTDNVDLASDIRLTINNSGNATFTGDVTMNKNTPVLTLGVANTSTGNAKLQFYSKNSGSANGYAIQYNKTSSVDRLEFIDGSGNPVAYINNGGGTYLGGASTVNGALTATSFVKSGGTSSQYLMADGSVSTTTFNGGTVANATTFSSDVTIDKDSARLILQDNSTGNALNQWVSYRDDNGTERAYVGYGSTSNSTFYVVNHLSDLMFYAGGVLNETKSGANSTFAGTLTSTGFFTANNGMQLGGSNKTLELLYNGTTSYRGNLGWSYLQMGNNGSNDIIGGNTATGGTLRFFTNNTNDCGADTAPNGTLALTLGTTGHATFTGKVITGQGYNDSGFLTGTNLGLYTAVTLPYFTNGVANLAVDITLGNASINGVIEIELTGTYSHQNTVGSLRRKWHVGFNANGSIWSAADVIEESSNGPIDGQLYMSDPYWDSSASTYKVRVYHKVSTGNQYSAKITAFSLGYSSTLLDNIAVSGLLTSTSTASSHTSGKTFNGDVTLLADGTNSINLNVASGTDYGYATIGRMTLGKLGWDDHAGWKHEDAASQTQYAFLQNEAFDTFMNAGSGRTLYFRTNNSNAMYMTASAATFAGTVTASGIHSNSGTVSFADGGSSFDSSDAQGYARFTHAGGSAQIGLFRSSNAIGGVHIGGDDGGFNIYASTDAAGTFGNQILDLDMSGNLQIDGYLTASGAGGSSFYAIALTRSGGTTDTVPDIWSDSNNFVLGYDSNNYRLALRDEGSQFAGSVGIGTAPTTTKFKVQQATAAEWGAHILCTGANPYGLAIQTDANASQTYSLAVYTQSAQDFYIRNDGIFSMGVVPYTTSHVLNLDGTGLAIKNDVNGSGNNWSSIRNLDSSSAANLVFTTGGGTALTLDHDMDAHFGNDVYISGDLHVNPDADSTLSIKNAGTNATAIYAGSSDLLYIGAHNDWQMYFSTNGYAYLRTWMNFAAGQYGVYSSTNGAHLFANTGSSYGVWKVNGTRNSYTGIAFGNGGDAVTGMYDSGGNGGDYNSSTGWHFYYHRSNDCLGVADSTTSSSYGLYVTGAIYSTADVVAYSDERAKENIVTVDNALDKVSELRGVYYNKKDSDDDKRQVGVIAQEVKEVLPEVVTYDKENDKYGVDYGKINGLLIEAIKDLKKEVEELKQCKKCVDCDCNN